MHKEYIEKYTQLGYDMFVVYGDSIDCEYTINLETRIIVLKCEDTFEALPNKTYMLLKMFAEADEMKDYNMMIKMDDDTELNLSYNMLMNMKFWENNYDYMGAKLIKSKNSMHDYHFGKCSDMTINTKLYELEMELSWGAGYFYILSRNIINTLYEDIKGYPDLLNENLYEDMMIGYMMANNNILFNEVLQGNVVTNLNRPRKTSLSNILIAQDKIIYYPSKNFSKIKKITYNFNKNNDNNNNDNNDNNNNNNDNNIDNKLMKETMINNELNKKIAELSKKLNINTNQTNPPNMNRQTNQPNMTIQSNQTNPSNMTNLPNMIRNTNISKNIKKINKMVKTNRK